MKNILSAVCLSFLCSFSALAQVNAIPFAQSIDTFQLINGTVIDVPYEDDIFHADLPIGFNFVYNGVATGKFGLCTNGYITMDSLMHSSLWNINANSENQINVLVADMMNTNPGGSIEYATIGTAPNRVCIIQWKDYSMFGNPYCHLNAQIRLFETSNCIQLYYGTNALAGNQGEHFGVGLTGASVNDFNLRTTNTDWINSSAVAVFPGFGMLLTPLINLPSGLVFTFGSCPPAGVQFSYISGNVYEDVNNNGARDPGENGVANIIIHETAQNSYATTDTAGNYSLFFIDSNMTYTPTAVPLMYWTISSVPAVYSITLVSQSTQNRDFGLYPTPNIHDVTISTVSGNLPWPTANISFFTTFHNNGTLPEPGDSIFLVKDSHYSFNFSNPAPAYMSGDSIVWIYSNLLVNEFRNITMQLHADSTITIGDTLHCYWTIKPINGDVAPLNNFCETHQPCLAAFDPNSKEVSPAGDIINSEELSYTIHFQNTGTAPALNVFLHDTLDANLDVSTFKILGSSHPMTYTISGSGIVQFTFANINLPDSNANEPASHGAVLFSIKPKSNLNTGISIHNTASIVFDFNDPIITNTTQNIIIESMPNAIQTLDTEHPHLLIFPNPAADHITIQSDQSFEQATIRISDVSGKAIMKKEFRNSSKIDMDLSQLKSGMFVIEVLSNGKSSSRKLIKR